MSKINIWGHFTWVFLHTIIEKLKNESLSILPDLVKFLNTICYNLPCPTCASHAKLFLTNKNLSSMNKEQLKETFWIFHNAVNRRLKKEMYNKENLTKYKDYNLNNTFNNFMKVFKTTNLPLSADTFHRKSTITKIHKWFLNNRIHFD